MDELAPSCTWEPFRQWALTAMSCQASMDDSSKLTRAHTHIARAVSGCFKVLKHFLRHGNLESRFGNGTDHVELAEVVNLMYWMTRIQAELGTPPAKISDWDHHFVPFQYTIKSVQNAAQKVEDLGICKNRLWNLVNVSDRKHGDLPDIVLALSDCGSSLAHKEHNVCTPSKCQGAQMDSTKMEQLHKCKGQDCEQKMFPVELLATNIEVDKSTAWICNQPRPKSVEASAAAPKLNGVGKEYIAISHVWSDGTGVGVKPAGSVNTCLYDFFAGLALRLGCKALWWDAISIPQEFKARHKALNTMHMNYALAKYTVVHDTYLMNFPWSDDGSPCLALVLSTWFTRGWTALELAMAKKVKVLFKDPDPTKTDPIIKDLDDDVLAKSPRGASRAHWLATCLVQRLRKPVEDVGDLITVLAPRSTSFTRDRTIIACLLAGVPEVDFQDGESVMTRQILEYLGRIPYFCLLHGKPTMRETGGFSWSPATLDDMPVEVVGGMQNLDDDMVESMFEIDDKGSIWGSCFARNLNEGEVRDGTIKAYGDNLAATIKVNLALADWKRCLLIRPTSKSNDPRCLLVAPIGILKDDLTIKCRYIGTVLEEQHVTCNFNANILIGGRDKGEEPLEGRWALEEAPWVYDPQFNNFGEMIIKRDDPRQIEPQDSSAHQDPVPDTSLTENDIADLADQLEHLDVDHMETEDVSKHSLILALAYKNKGATRFLVTRGITVTPDNLFQWLQHESDLDDLFMRECRGLSLLGDVYMENGHTRLAIEAYQKVMDKEHEEEAEEDGELSTTFLQVRLSLGRAFLVHRRETSSDESESGLDGNTCVDKAKQLFSFIVDEGEKRGNYRTIAIKRPEGLGAPNPPKETETEKPQEPAMGITRRKTGALNNKAGEESTRRDERRANKILRLELDAAAELIVLAISEFDFPQASNIYRKALRHFGEVSKDFVFEGFKPRWVERKTDEASVKEKRDKDAATLYHRALKRLSTLFKKHHLLVLITNIHLGVNFDFRASLRDATIHLTNALEGLECYSKKLQDRHASHSTPSVIEHDHPIIALVKYHRGEVYLQQERWKDAYEDLGSVLEILPVEKLEARELRNVTKLELTRYYLRPDQPNPEAAKETVLPMIDEYKREEPRDELHTRLLIETQFMQAKVEYAFVK
ncbi:hypothetical protein FGADI_12825 [Fusarium gaditjirri]|uniref:Heterokaryon incompatibility domain-containing protein n=1 Tax=Fusarium gaditjirri TaxID=282569 RepID=A0A8H4SRQ2_9HYPO|nr:hypothetical protein FGADI_12825 [Fusarium gaditjirri]